MRKALSYAEAHAPRKPKERKRIKARRVTKGGRGRDPEKLAWLRSLRCLCFASDPMGCRRRVETHHDRPGGSRATDARCVPLCGLGHHRDGPHSIGVLGRRVFQRFHKLDLAEQCRMYQTEWQVRKESGAA